MESDGWLSALTDAAERIARVPRDAGDVHHTRQPIQPIDILVPIIEDLAERRGQILGVARGIAPPTVWAMRVPSPLLFCQGPFRQRPEGTPGTPQTARRYALNP